MGTASTQTRCIESHVAVTQWPGHRDIDRMPIGGYTPSAPNVFLSRKGHVYYITAGTVLVVISGGWYGRFWQRVFRCCFVRVLCWISLAVYVVDVQRLSWDSVWRLLSAVRFTLLRLTKELIRNAAGSDLTTSEGCNTNDACIPQPSPPQNSPYHTNISQKPLPPQHLVTFPNGHNPSTLTAPSGHRIPHSKYIGN